MSGFTRNLPICTGEYLEGGRLSQPCPDLLVRRNDAKARASLRREEVSLNTVFLPKNHLNSGPLPTLIDRAKFIIALLSPPTSHKNRVDEPVNDKGFSCIAEIVYIGQDRSEISIVRRSERWRRHHYTTLVLMVHVEWLDLIIRESAFYQTTTFSDDIGRPQ
jgi:hypothetical protein